MRVPPSAHLRPKKTDSQPVSSDLLPLNHWSPTRGPGAACRTSVYFIQSPLSSYSNQRMVPGSVSKKFLKLHRFSAKVLRFKKGLLCMEVTYSILQYRYTNVNKAFTSISENPSHPYVVRPALQFSCSPCVLLSLIVQPV